MRLSSALLAVLTLVFAPVAMAQDDLSAEETLRSEGLDWLLPISDCPMDIRSEKAVEIDVDRRSCEDHLSKCVDQCRQGDAERCYTAGLSHERLENEAHADALYQEACRSGVAIACVNFAARMRSSGTGEERCIANTFFAECERDSLWGCAMSSLVVWQEEGVEEDPDLASEYARKTCALDPDHAACQLAEEILAEIETPEVSNEN